MDTNTFASSGLFSTQANVKRPFKMSFEGFAGDGKSHTMALVVKGIWLAEDKRKTVILVDTERSAKFFNEIFAPVGLVEGKNFFVTASRSLADWIKILKLCEEQDAIMMTDTVTHLYEDMVQAYLRANQKTEIAVQDHMQLKPAWKQRFSTPYVNATCHCLFTGRAAWEYGMERNEQTGKREFFKSGIKMRGDNETAFEPDILVLMQRDTDIQGKKITVSHNAIILKDRSNLLDGETFKNPTFATFEPVYKLLCVGEGYRANVKETSMEEGLQVDKDRQHWDRRRRVEIFTEEIQGLFASYIPGQGPKEKKLKADVYQLVFNTRSQTALEQFKPETLKAGMEEIEHLLSYLDEQAEFLGKLQASGEAVNVVAWLGEELVRFKENRLEKTVTKDDEIDFDVAGTLEEGKDGKNGKDHENAMDQIIKAIENDFKRAPTRAGVFKLWETYRPMIEEKMTEEQRESLIAARDARVAYIEAANSEKKGKKKEQSQLEV